MRDALDKPKRRDNQWHRQRVDDRQSRGLSPLRKFLFVPRSRFGRRISQVLVTLFSCCIAFFSEQRESHSRRHGNPCHRFGKRTNSMPAHTQGRRQSKRCENAQCVARTEAVTRKSCQHSPEDSSHQRTWKPSPPAIPASGCRSGVRSLMAPEITAVSKPKRKPPRAATRALFTRYKFEAMPLSFWPAKRNLLFLSSARNTVNHYYDYVRL